MKVTGQSIHQWIKMITEAETISEHDLTLDLTSPTREEISSESYMIPSGKTLPGARRPKPPLTRASNDMIKASTRIGTWNIRTRQVQPHKSQTKCAAMTARCLESVKADRMELAAHNTSNGRTVGLLWTGE